MQPHGSRRNYVNGKRASVDTFTLSSDGQTLTIHTPIQSDGKTVDQSVTMLRTVRGSDLVGEWKGDPIKMSPFMLEIALDPNDGLTFRIADVFEIKGRFFDGKPDPDDRTAGSSREHGDVHQDRRARFHHEATVQGGRDARCDGDGFRRRADADASWESRLGRPEVGNASSAVVRFATLMGVEVIPATLRVAVTLMTSTAPGAFAFGHINAAAARAPRTA